MRVLSWITGVLFLITGSGMALSTAYIQYASATENVSVTTEQQMIMQCNAIRARSGLAPLVWDGRLQKSSESHCTWMANSARLQHTSAMVAENIAMGQNGTSEVYKDWMNSPGHRANILNGSYKKTGVAAYVGRDGRNYWCQQFSW